MKTFIRLFRNNKQVLELFCLVVSAPLVWYNVELHLSELYPTHSSVVAALNYRRVRELSFNKLEDVESSNMTETVSGKENEFDTAFREGYFNSHQ